MNIPRVTKLDNGLRIITEQVRDIDSIALSIRVGVGSRAESAKQNGISHFLEHMAFKGTKTRAAFEIAKAFDDIGGVFNASTGRESTTYYAKVLKKDMKTGIDILIDILMNSTFPEDELEREKGVVIQEIFQTNDSPSDVLFAVAGNVEHEEVIALTKDFLSKIHSKKLKKSQNASCTGGEYLEHRKLDQVHLLIGLPSVSRHDDKYHTFQVLDSILGSGMSSRLSQEVREKQGLAYSVYSFNSSYTDTGIFSIFAGTDSSNLDKLLKSITTELKKLSTDDLKEEEINRVKGRVKSQILMSRESVSSRAETLEHYYGNYNRYISKNELIEKISAVTTANLKKAAEELLSQHEKTALAAIGKIESLPSYDKVVSMLKA